MKALQHTHHQAVTNVVVTVAGFIAAGKLVYRNITSGQYSLRGSKFPRKSDAVGIPEPDAD